MSPSRIVPIVALAAAGLANQAHAGETPFVYWTNFEEYIVEQGWSSQQRAETPDFTRFLGNLGNGSVSLDLGGLKAGATYLVRFDFYAIDSWDGSDTPWGPDRFELRADSDLLFSETFSNWGGPQTYTGDPKSFGSDLGFRTYNDSIWELVAAFVPTDGDVRLTFSASGLEPVHNESWGIDNLSVQMIPAPGGAAAIALGVGATGLRRRRR